MSSVSLSLPSLITQLKQHVSSDKIPKLDKLLRDAQENKDQQTIKQEIFSLAGKEELRDAVNALVQSQEATPDAGAAASSADDVESAAINLFGAMPKEVFKASLIHCFHCRTPSCPVPECANISGKLQRLHQHVSGCTTEGCVLCRIWTFLKYYRDSSEQLHAAGAVGAVGAAGGGAAYVGQQHAEPLLQSTQLLPRWQDGKISWLPPHEALAQVYAMLPRTADGASAVAHLAAGAGAAAADGGPPGKRRRTSARAAAAARRRGAAAATAAPPPPRWGRRGCSRVCSRAPAAAAGRRARAVGHAERHRPRGASAAHAFEPGSARARGRAPQRPRRSAPRRPPRPSPPPPSLTPRPPPPAQAQMNGAMRQLLAENPAGMKGLPLGLSKSGISGLGLSFSGALPLAANPSLSGINLDDLIRCSSFGQPGAKAALGGGGGADAAAAAPPPVIPAPGINLSFSRSTSELKAKNASEISLGSLLDTGNVTDLLAEFGNGGAAASS